MHDWDFNIPVCLECQRTANFNYVSQSYECPVCHKTVDTAETKAQEQQGGKVPCKYEYLHIWRDYVGFTHAYKYCVNCDIKRY